MTTVLTDDEQLSEIFNALANPVRRAMLARLAEGEAGVNELAEPFGLSLPAISRHVKVLERAGLVTQGRRAQFRPCRLEAEPLRRVAAWTEQYRAIWDDRFDQLDDYLHALDDSHTSNSHTDDTDNSDTDNSATDNPGSTP